VTLPETLPFVVIVAGFLQQGSEVTFQNPNTPAEQGHYVWRFNKDGSNPRRKAPEAIFHETDMYTIPQADSGRDLVIERGLAGLEGEFVTIRDTRTWGPPVRLGTRPELALLRLVAANGPRRR
jgi:Protein of unknown function (DUF4238)